MKNRNGNLGSRPGTLYVTRAATLEYQKLTRAPFETARRALTERLHLATPDRERPGAYLLPIRGDARLHLRVFVVQEGALLVVPKIEAYEPAELAP
ncbi:MAG: hypothetical protein M0R28_21000 [Pigmentiphaga sp.]|nr:hypothetical protein [Pigmentiphaga sp.]